MQVRVLTMANGTAEPVGMHWVRCRTPSEVVATLARASERRLVGCTRMNLSSSRSHTIVYLQVRARADRSNPRPEP